MPAAPRSRVSYRFWHDLAPASRIALRNVLRQRRRSAFGVLSVAFGVVALLLAAGFIEWVFWAMREDTIRSRLGHYQVVRDGYFAKGVADPFNFLLADGKGQREMLEREPGVRAVAPRLNFGGLIAAGESTLSFMGEGIVASKETAFDRAVVIQSGRGLADDDANGIILGEGLAANLGVKVGDTVTLLANTREGGINGLDARVRGTFSTVVKAFDDTALRVPLPLAQKLIRVSGVHTWIVVLDDTARTDQAVVSAKARLADPSLEVVPWTTLADFYNKTVVLFSKQVGVMRMIIAAIIILSILNTLTATVMERTGEIGTSMALGVRRAAILRQFILEGLMLGVVGGILGLTLGWLLATVISAIGIPMPPPPGMARGFNGAIRVTPSLLFDAAALALVTTLLASLYPAWKASRLNVVDALRHNR